MYETQPKLKQSLQTISANISYKNIWLNFLEAKRRIQWCVKCKTTFSRCFMIYQAPFISYWIHNNRTMYICVSAIVCRYVYNSTKVLCMIKVRANYKHKESYKKFDGNKNTFIASSCFFFIFIYIFLDGLAHLPSNEIFFFRCV